jgi:hypothetical protein
MPCIPGTSCRDLRIKNLIRGTNMNVRSEIELLRRELVNELQVGRGLMESSLLPKEICS